MQEQPERKRFRLTTIARVVKRGAEDDAALEEHGDASYDTFDSGLESFDGFFRSVLMPHTGISDLVQREYADQKGRMVAAELGGPGRKLFAELNNEGMFRQTVGFALHDPRTEHERGEDALRGHAIVMGDAFFRRGAAGRSWNEVESWCRENGKPTLLIERMVQGIDLVRSADLYVAMVKRWLEQLAPGGTLLAEIPRMPAEEGEKVAKTLALLSASKIVVAPDTRSVLIKL